MPNGLWYAGGDSHKYEESIPASAFSAGDLLFLTSASSLSRFPELMPSGALIAGVAVGGSNQSIANKCSYLIPGADTLFWASCSTALTSHLTVGEKHDINFGLGNNRSFVVASQTSSRCVIVRGTQEVDQSVQSKVLVRLLVSGAETNFI